MRQAAGLLKVIQKRNYIEFYDSALAYRYSQQEKLPSLEEFLSPLLGEEETTFNEDADKFLEEQAVKRLKERQGIIL